MADLTHDDDQAAPPASLQRHSIDVKLRRARLLVAAEVLGIAVWALFVTRPYMDMNPNVVPVGREFLSAIQTHHAWTWAQSCGMCAFWNGSERGGAPTFADPYGSMLHPLVALATLGWGVRNGAKVALIIVFIAGGFAQWWLAWTIGLGRVARLWSGALAVVAGHLGARAENGNFGLLLSTVACALVLPPLIGVVRGGGRCMAVVLGITLASAIVAGQGYMQIGLACIAPLFLLLLPQDHAARWRIVHHLAGAGGLALLLAGVFLVPFLHFLPQFGKYLDPEFRNLTPFFLMPLHLVIDDPDFYYTTALSKLPYPYLYTNFIGWIPVALALWAGYRHLPAQRRMLIVLTLATVVALWVASGMPLVWIANHVPPLANQMAAIRFHTVIAGLAIPPLLALAAIGVDRLMHVAELRLHLALSRADEAPRGVALDPRVLLVVPLLFALLQAYQFNGRWIATTQLLPEVGPVLAAIRTPDMQWVNPPFGEHDFVEPAIGAGMKLSSGFRTWNWKDHKEPFPFREADRKGVQDGMQNVGMIGPVLINAAQPGSEYAVVIAPGGKRTVCTANGLAGNIDVRCDTPEGGVLTIKENVWNGWNAQIGGVAATFLPGQWMSINVPPGAQQVTLRYQPWDVVVGMVLTLVGVALAGWLLLMSQEPGVGVQARWLRNPKP